MNCCHYFFVGADVGAFVVGAGVGALEGALVGTLIRSEKEVISNDGDHGVRGILCVGGNKVTTVR